MVSELDCEQMRTSPEDESQGIVLQIGVRNDIITPMFFTKDCTMDNIRVKGGGPGAGGAVRS